ncbi:MAG: cytochrome c family protein [Coriobacteriia bacterium]|nr:cytochrome c family protein [Coriobacteriia bacterium]
MRSVKRHVAVLALAAATWAMSTSVWGLPSVPSSTFEPAEGCGCHAALYDQWQASMHAKALTDPLYLYKLAEADKATNGALGPFCNGCHGPVAVMAGEVRGTDISKASQQARQGVTCDLCHQVVGTRGKLGNTSIEVQPDGVKRAQLKDAVSPSHATAYSAFHESAEFCGNCHNVDHPVNGMHLEMTYTEWKNGPYAKQGIVCQDCHMTPGPGVTKPNPGKAAAGGPERPHIYTMTFAGGNVGLGDAARAEERLKAAAEVSIEVPEIVQPGAQAVATVTVTNVGAGHYLPTGLTEVRQMWLTVEVVDTAGKTVASTRHDYGTVLKDAKGNHPVELWDAVAIHSDDRIPPKGSSTDTIAFAMPNAAVTVRAALYYRSAPEEMAKKAGVEIPTTEMAKVEKAVYASADEKARAAAPPAPPSGAGAGGLLTWIAAAAVLVGGIVAGFLIARKRA